MKERFRAISLAAALTTAAGCSETPKPTPSFTDFKTEPAPTQITPLPSLTQSPRIEVTPTHENLSDKPNIIVFMLDDINPIDGRLWEKDRMPTVFTTFKEQGIEFREYYGETPLCCPGRVNFLTGQHTQNHGVLSNDGKFPEGFSPNTSLATELQDAGYKTIIVGKYLNKFNNFKDKTPKGWDYQAIPNLNNVGKFYDYELVLRKGIEKYGNEPEDYINDVFINKTLEFMRDVPSDQPIFAYLNPFSAHEPYTPAPRHENSEKCEDIESYKPEGFKHFDQDDPDFIKNSSPKIPDEGFNLVKICESLLVVDDYVKAVVDELRAQERLENTILVFTADNGMSWGDHNLHRKENPFSVEIPLMIHWENGRGLNKEISDTVLSNIDLPVTLAEAAQVDLGPYPNGQENPDGLNFLELIKNNEENPNFKNSREFILESQPLGNENIPGWWAVRSTEIASIGNYHFILYNTNEMQLFDLNSDPNQLNNLAYDEDMKDVVKELKIELEKLKTEFKEDA